jgi:hypothetical protein
MNLTVYRRARRALATLCVVWLATNAALAQDPRATAAQAAARDWLELTDRGNAQASWATAGKKFQAALPASGWADSLKKARAPFGAITSRAIFKTVFQTTFPGAPEGDYALIDYTTNFAGRPAAHETVTLERETDGAWRVVGYYIR